MSTRIEICGCNEWLADGYADGLPTEDRDRIARARYEAAWAELERRGLTPNRTSPKRSLYHGWNGGHFAYRSGAVGLIYGDLTPELEAAIDAADEAGCMAAQAEGEKIESETETVDQGERP